ncbi:MAG: DNRLRE domain-containing protein [Minicystis sp.]
MRPSTFIVPFLAAIVSMSCTERSGSDPRSRAGEARESVVGESARADLTHSAVVAVRTVGTSLCSGTIIRRSADGNKLFVLTAAHCCRPGNPPRKVMVGADYADPQLVLPVESFQSHPCYNPLSNDYDFCVLEVPDQGTLNVTPIPLASAPDDLEDGSEVTAVGFGSTPASNTIRRVTTAKLTEVAPLTLAIDQREGRGGICFGDSGGPLLSTQDDHDVVAGVISFGAPTSLCNVIGAAERVSFRGVRDEFLDKVLAGEKVTVDMLLLRRDGMTLGPVRDTFIASDQPDRNFGERVDMRIGTPPGSDAVRRALIRFDLSALPAGATVLTARVGLHEEGRTGEATLSIHPVTKEWDEQRETWSSFGPEGFDRRPLVSFSNATAVIASTEEVWFDTTELVDRWASGEAPNYGLLLRQPEAQETQLLSSEIGRISDRPWMSICYLPAKH